MGLLSLCFEQVCGGVDKVGIVGMLLESAARSRGCGDQGVLVFAE